MKKAIVIGAGVGGLALSIRLAIKGYKVIVYEANDYPGGKLSELEFSGFRFDAGPSLFTMPEKIEELFKLSGKNINDYFEYIKIDEICKYYFQDGNTITAQSDLEAFASEIERKFDVSKNKVLTHLKKSEFIYNTIEHLFLEKSLHKINSYLCKETFNSFLKLPFLNILSSMHKTNNKYFKNKYLVQFFDRYATYNGSNPYKASGILNLIPHLEFKKGTYFPKGGMHSITKALYKLGSDLDVDFQFNAKVKKIMVKNKKAIGVELDKNVDYSDIIISNMDIVPTYKYLLKDEKIESKVMKQERSSSALIFYWGINKEFNDLKLHNVFFSADYQEEFNHIFNKKTIYHDPTIYVNISCKYNKSDAPDRKENWFVMINVPENIGQNWEHLIKESKKNIIKKLSENLNTDFKKLIDCEKVLNPIEIERKTSSHNGSIYGTSSNSRLSAFFRHSNFSNKINSLYFVGGSVHPGGGIPLALSSAKITSKLID